jgi:pyruvate dehydrogenase complex dehydrogenase (E1) component
MPPTTTIQSLNRDLALKINAEGRSNPQSPYANKFVGIANGQVVAVADTLKEMVRQLRQVEPDPTRTICVEASEDLDKVHEIWSLR